MCSNIRDTLRKEGYNYITDLEEARRYITTISPDDPFHKFYRKEGNKIYPKYVFKKLSLKFDDPLIFATDKSEKWKENYKKFWEKKALVEKSTIYDKTDFEKAIDLERHHLAFNAPICPPGLLSVDMAKIFEILDGELEMEWNEDLYYGVKDYLKKYELYKCMLD